MPDSNRQSTGEFETTIYQAVNQSVGQICTQMSLANIKIPQFNLSRDVFDFIADYETATIALGDDQKLKLLAKAFPPGRHRSWFETEIVPLVDTPITWREVKAKIIKRFSETDNRNRHFIKLRELKFNPESGERLLDFVEDLLYSYRKAYPDDINEESRVCFIKAAIPSSLKPTLGMIPEYRSSTTEQAFKEAIKQYDVSHGNIGHQVATRNEAAKMSKVLEGFLTEWKKQGEEIKEGIIAAVRMPNERSSYQEREGRSRGFSPRRLNYASPSRQNRERSPMIVGRAQSPHNYGSAESKVERQDLKVQPNDSIQQQNSSTSGEKIPFDAKAYYKQHDGEIFRVIVDTGATISFLPGNGALLKSHKLRPLQTNVNIRLADESISHINKKVLVGLRPKGSSERAQQVPFYISDDATKILQHDALIGLNILKLFNLDIKFENGEVFIYHDSHCIGREYPVPADYRGSIKVDDRFDKVETNGIVLSIIKRYRKVFADIDKYQPIRGQPMRIWTVHQRPIFAKQRHYNPGEILQMKEHVKSLLDKGIIEKTESGYAATSRIIPKKSGAGRLVINYIPLNAVTLRDSYSLPQISDILGVLQGMNFFTTMDCAQGFYQIMVDPRDRHKTAFSTPVGNYQFKRCPFGARNSCAVFQSEMNRIFGDGLYTKCVIYVDDILVFGETLADHNANLEWVLSQCAKHNVKIKLDKCSFAQKEVKYLGFLISGNCIKPLQDKLESLTATQPPKDKTELRSVVGKLNFYSRFIPNYSKQLEPLRELFRKNKDYQWRPHHQAAYERVLKSLDSAPSLRLAPRSEEKILEIGIMNDSIEVLCLDKEDALLNRMSRLLSVAESNYSYIEKQMLALVAAVDKFRIWLEPGKVTIRTPNKDLEKQFGLINRPERVENLLLKMPEGYDTFKFEVKALPMETSANKMRNHVPQEIYYIDGACRANGKENCRASWGICAEFDRDLAERGYVTVSPSNNSAEVTAAIKCCEIAKSRGQDEITIVTDSRYLHSAATSWIDKWRNNDWKDYKSKPVVNTDLFKDLMIAKDGLQIEWIHVKGHCDHPGNIRADLLAGSLLDRHSEVLCAAMVGNNDIQAESGEIKKLLIRIEEGKEPNLIVENGTIYYIDKNLPETDCRRKYVPESSREWMLKMAHDDKILGGHLGQKKTFRKLIGFWWPGMHKYVEEYVRSCDLCQMFKSPSGLPPGYLHSIPVSGVFQTIHLDMVGPVKRTHRGNSYIITATDAFSKWAFARQCQTIRTSEVIKFVEECIISIHGKPATFITDRGSQFISSEWKLFIEKIGAEHKLTAPYNPKANGIDERLNGTLVKILNRYVEESQEDWDEQLKWALYVYNTTVHESTGYSPYQILHGLDPRTPLKSQQPSEINSVEELNKARRIIRSKANEENMAAQAKQSKEYNHRHKQVNYRVGQQVWLKVQSIPNDLSKKLHPNWDGPCLITEVLGDKENPRAIKVFNLRDHSHKFVAIANTKPHYIRKYAPSGLEGGEKEPTNPERKGEAQEHVELASQDYSPGLFYSSDGDEGSPIHKFSTLNYVDELPLTSSPRRVTINDETQIFNYSVDLTDVDAQDQDPTRDQDETEVQERPIISPYICEFILDDSIKDPTYKGEPPDEIDSSRFLRSQSQPQHQDPSTKESSDEEETQVQLDTSNEPTTGARIGQILPEGVKKVKANFTPAHTYDLRPRNRTSARNRLNETFIIEVDKSGTETGQEERELSVDNEDNARDVGLDSLFNDTDDTEILAD